jgi:hypothetical protein
MAMSGEEFKERFDNGTLPKLSLNKCDICKENLPDHPDPPRFIDKKEVCEDCYWKSLGDVLEQHPIHHPGRHGPGGISDP